MVTDQQKEAIAPRMFPIDRLLCWLRDLRDFRKAPKFPLPSTYDEVIYDPKTDTCFGILYPKELHEARKDEPVVVRSIEDFFDDEGKYPQQMWFVEELGGYNVPASCAGVCDYS